jgi:hypothetical protein
MVKFTIGYMDCFGGEGTKSYTAPTSWNAQVQFEQDFGPDYIVIYVRRTKP